MKKEISIILPAANEEKLLSTVISELVSYLNRKDLGYEILIIENGSLDKTLEIAKKLAISNQKIKVFHLPYARYGLALLEGFKNAIGEYVVIFNVDFWDKKFIDLCQVDLLGYDIVTGSKNLPGSSDKRPFGRRLVTRIFSILLKTCFGHRGTDTHGIKVLRRQIILPVIKKCKTNTGIFDSELLIRAQREGQKILELPVEIAEKRANRFGFRRILETPKDLVKLYLALQS